MNDKASAPDFGARADYDRPDSDKKPRIGKPGEAVGRIIGVVPPRRRLDSSKELLAFIEGQSPGQPLYHGEIDCSVTQGGIVDVIIKRRTKNVVGLRDLADGSITIEDFFRANIAVYIEGAPYTVASATESCRQ